jgi:hypothetical protein
MAQPIQSDAFRHAALRSERYRIIAMMVLMVILAVFDVVHRFIKPQVHDLQWLAGSLTCVGVFLMYEAVMVWVIARAQRRGRAVGNWVWALNTLIECSLPTVAIMGLTVWESYLGPYKALVSPAILVYCFFITLSTLRLSPALCVFAGAVSAAGYIAAIAFTMWMFPKRSATAVMPLDVFIASPIVLLGCGIIAAVVARQIRQHVIAALVEAETRRKLDRIEHDLRTARAIQMGLLPKRPPDVAGYDIAGWSQPADQTGGDYYDWMELPGNRVIFTIADATGHGIGPALLIAACRAYFRAIAMHGDPLESITAQVDALIANDVTDGRFITAAIALLDPAQHRLSLYSAGHAPIYLYRAKTSVVETLDADQPPLGFAMTPTARAPACSRWTPATAWC